MRDQRDLAADEAMNGYDFGENVEVVAMDGWQRTEPGNEWVRKVYIESEETRSVNEGSRAVAFTVRFEHAGPRVVEAYAIDDGGNIFGTAAAAI